MEKQLPTAQQTELKRFNDVQSFYERRPYPAPLTNLDRHRELYRDPLRRRAQFHLLWPERPYTTRQNILVAGCGTSQAATIAMREPDAHVFAIDISSTSLENTQALKQKYGLDNLEIHQLGIEAVSALEQEFDQIICTGVLHHLPDPVSGLNALRNVLSQQGAIDVMVYGQYGRTGVYMLQEYCRMLGLATSDRDLDDLRQTLDALPPGHPIAAVMQQTKDFMHPDALADALLHPQDRAYTVPQLYEWLNQAGLVFGRWVDPMPNGKPNVLILWGDDIGQSNLSCYSDGLMGYQTPNIDRQVAKEGATASSDYYAEQSCTAGRAAFISGQSVIRTGLSKVGLPGAKVGYQDEDPTIAELLKPQGYRTGQFGKNHFGDRDEYLPTMHGFDEFFGNLYHLNAEEEPELRDYPPEADYPNFRKNFGPRGVLHCWANGDGTQRIENTGPLTKKRMETADEEFMKEAKRFIKDAVASGEPFFVWFNTTHMHFRTHARPQDIGQSGRWQSEYHDVMIYHDNCIGQMLDLLDELGITDDTIVMYSTDNGPHMNSWPDAGMTPFRNEKNSNWEGAYRVPCLVRWPGHIEAGTPAHRHRQPSRLAAHDPGGRRRTGDQAEVP
jgi:SAM-dependent methyltransferase